MKLVRYQVMRAVKNHLEARPDVAAFDLVLDGETIKVTDPNTQKEEKSDDKQEENRRTAAAQQAASENGKDAGAD